MRENMNVFVVCSDMKSKTDIKSELAKAISISTAEPKSRQADKMLLRLWIVTIDGFWSEDRIYWAL
jgi:hypothetical protein